jgi:hypothetical protein
MSTYIFNRIMSLNYDEFRAVSIKMTVVKERYGYSEQ